MMWECGNEEHDDSNVNGTDVNINNINEGEGKFPDIIYPTMIVECEY